MSPFDAARKLLESSSMHLSMSSRTDLVFQDPTTSLVPLLVQENYLNHRPAPATDDRTRLKVRGGRAGRAQNQLCCCAGRPAWSAQSPAGVHDVPQGLLALSVCSSMGPGAILGSTFGGFTASDHMSVGHQNPPGAVCTTSNGQRQMTNDVLRGENGGCRQGSQAAGLPCWQAALQLSASSSLGLLPACEGGSMWPMEVLGSSMCGLSPCPCPKLVIWASGCSASVEAVPQQMVSPTLLHCFIACPAVHCQGSRPDQRGRPGQPPGAAEAELGTDALCGHHRQCGPRRLHERRQGDIWAVPRGGQLPKVR